MECPKCWSTNRESDLFCRKCGSKLIIKEKSRLPNKNVAKPKTQQEIYKKQDKDGNQVMFIIWCIVVISVLFFGVVLTGGQALLFFVIWPMIWFFNSRKK